MKMKLLVAVLGLTLSAGVVACPTDQFQRQTGNFKWMVTGQFNGSNFTREGTGIQSFVQLIRKHRAAVTKTGDGGIVKKAKFNFIGAPRTVSGKPTTAPKSMFVPRRSGSDT